MKMFLVFFVFVAIAAAPMVNSSCPPACPCHWENSGGRCYFVSKKPAASWHEARRACRASGGDLAVPTSEVANRRISNLLRKRKVNVAYIGLYRVDKDVANIFFTVDGLKATFTYWRNREPNNYGKGEGCTELICSRGGRWNDIRCGARRHYVCERSILRN